jgi:hypothetical protein
MIGCRLTADTVAPLSRPRTAGWLPQLWCHLQTSGASAKGLFTQVPRRGLLRSSCRQLLYFERGLGLPLYATHKVIYYAPVLVLLFQVSRVCALLEDNPL